MKRCVLDLYHNSNSAAHASDLLTEARAQRDWLIKECERIGVLVNVRIGALITEAYQLELPSAEYLLDAHNAAIAAEREKLKPLVDALEELRTWTDPHVHERVIIDDALAKVKECQD